MMKNLENLVVVKTESIQDAENAAAKVSRIQKNLLKPLLKRNYMLLNGKKLIEKKGFNKAVIGIKEIWNKLEINLSKLQKNILVVIMGSKKLKNDLQIGTKIILKKDECMIEPCMLLKQVKLLGRIFAVSVIKNVCHMHIMRIIQNLMMFYGYVQYAIFIYITNTNITVREQARKHRKMMRCSDPVTKVLDLHRNDVSANDLSSWLTSNSTWQAGGKARFIYLPPGYNNDPCINKILNVQVKPWVIDLECLAA
jgi:hypothetical protein